MMLRYFAPNGVPPRRSVSGYPWHVPFAILHFAPVGKAERGRAGPVLERNVRG